MQQLEVIERYYDTVPRVAATVEEVGPFTLFVANVDIGWTFYARPRLGLDTDITGDDVRRVLARQQELGVPRAIEWVDDTTPSLLPAVREVVPEAELEIVPLMVSVRDLPGRNGAPGTCEVMAGDSPDLAAVVGAVGAAFDGKDTFEPGRPGVRPRLLDEGTLVMVAAYDEQGAVVGGGSAAPRGDVAELMGIAVIGSARGRGIGSAVTNALRSACRERGAETVFLTAASDEATSIYTAVGFERIGTGCILGGLDD